MNETLDWLKSLVIRNTKEHAARIEALEDANAKLLERVEVLSTVLRIQHDERVAQDKQNKMLAARIDVLYRVMTLEQRAMWEQLREEEAMV